MATTATTNSFSYLFSTEWGADEFFDLASSFHGVRLVLYPVWNGQKDYKKVLVYGTKSFLFDHQLKSNLDKEYNRILIKENIYILRSRADKIKGNKKVAVFLRRRLLSESNRLENELYSNK